MTVRIGIGLFTGQVPSGSPRTFAREYQETIDLVRLAESLGFDSAWVSEHHGVSDGYLPSLLPLLGAFAAATDRITLGTGVILAPLHDPIRLAEDAAVVDDLSGGRLILGLGIGWRAEEFRMLRIPFAERRARLEESVEVLRRAWTGERFSYHGEIFDFDRIRVTPPPAQPGGPPIYLGGYAPAAVRRAGSIGDGYITDAAPAEDVRRALLLAEDAARGSGRDPDGLGLALLQNVVVGEGDAWAVARDGVAHQLGAYEAWEAGADTVGEDSLVIPPQDDSELRRWTPTGTAADVALELRPVVEEFGDRGEFHLIVRLHYPGMDFATASRAVESFGEDVVPALKGG
jgi:probable F420-dependent oxidoreductase